MSGLLAVTALLCSAWAQALDQTGPHLPVATGRTGPQTVHVSRQEDGEVAFSAMAESVFSPLVRVDSGPVLGNATGLRLSGAYGIHDRVSVGFTAPVWFATSGEASGGPAFGDARLYVPIRPVAREDTVVAVTPYATLPTGAAARYLGDRGVGGGILAGIDQQLGLLGMAAHGGVELDARGDDVFIGGPALLGALAAGPRTDVWSAQAELRLKSSISASPVLEGLLTGSGVVGPVVLSGGVGRGWTDSPGSPAFRVFAGVGGRFGAAAAPVGVDEITVVVRAPDGNVVRDAVIATRGGSEVQRTDADGLARVPARGLRRLSAVAEGFESADLPLPEGEATSVEVTLNWANVPLSVRVLDEDGQPIPDAVVTLDGPGPAPEPEQDETGTLSWALPTGKWVLTAEAEGMSRQVRKIDISPGRSEGVRVEAILFEKRGDAGDVTIDVRDRTGSEVEGAFITLDGAPLGTTASGGDLTVSGLAEGKLDLQVSHHRLEDAQELTVDLDKEARKVVVELGWSEGSVLVLARGPDDVATDAMVRFRGVEQLPPAALGRDGRRLFVLRPGQWTVLISSPTLGLQQRDFAVPEGAGTLTMVEVVLAEDERGDAALGLRVLDPDGRSLPNATVTLDGRPLGHTGNQGMLRLENLSPGGRTLAILGDALRPTERALTLESGYQEYDVVVPWKAGAVLVSASDPDDRPVDALVRGAGPDGASLSEPLGPDGELLSQLSVGDWQVLVSSPEHGMQSRNVSLASDDIRLHRASVRYVRIGQGDRELTVQVQESGNPLADAEVLVDGRSVGRTGDDGTIGLLGIGTGRRRLEAVAPGFERVATDIDIRRKTNRAELRTEAGPGLLEVSVLANGEPVTDALVKVAGDQPATRAWSSVDANGRVRIPLLPGRWDVLVSSPRFGMSQMGAIISADDQGPTQLDFELGSGEEDLGVLLLRVRDQDLQPVEGALIREADIDLGITTSGGSSLLYLTPGPHQLTLAPPGGLEPTTLDLDVSRGSSERTVRLEWPEVPVEIRLVGDETADVRFDGPGAPAPILVDGRAEVNLRPGQWSVYGVRDGRVGSVSFELTGTEERQSVEIELAQRSARLDVDQIRVEKAITFDLDEATIEGVEADAILDDLAALLLSEPRIVLVEIGGHTDATGGVRYNLELSQDRADAVRQELIARGVAPERLVARGYGMLRPLEVGNDERNRRVEFKVLEIDIH